jgi:hypothetical protein
MTFAQCWEAGQVLSLEEATAEALAMTGELGEASARSQPVDAAL